MEPSDVRVTIPGYRDLVRVGSGGFSMVYKAYQEAFDRTVAVKVLTVELVDETAQRRFQRECRASGRLSNHPSIVTVLDSGFTDDGRPYIATEFMTQGSLADHLESRGPYSVAETLDIGVLMCGALAAVHAAGILHRDIKPQNILVSDYGEPGLADFGISAITVGPEASIGTSSITPLHVAPEVLEGQPTSPASDVYSLGSTLYMLLAGRAPFQQGDEDALLPLMRRVVMDPVPDIERADVPVEVMDLLRYSMAKQPFARYPTAVSFGEAIQATQRHLGYPVTALRKPGTGTGDYQLPPAPEGTTLTDSGVPPSSAIVGAAGLAGAPAATVPPSVPPAAPTATGPGPTDPAPLVAPKKSSGGKVLVAVLVVVAVIAAALLARAKSEKVAASGPGASTTVARAGTSGVKSDPTDPNATTATTDGSNTASAGLRFDVEGPGLDPTPPSPGGVLRVAIDSEPGSWNPATSRFFDGTDLVASAVFDPLTVLTADGPKPYLATKLTPNAGFDIWTIELPKGVKFQDGTPFDAQAVKANFDARLANDLMSRTISPVESVKVDGTNVVVNLRQAWAAFPVALSGQAGYMASPAFLNGGDDGHPIGTGPFLFGKWDKGKTINMTKNSTYWKSDRPYLDGIDVSIIASNEDRSAALKGGQVDVAFITDPVVLDAIGNNWPNLVARTARVLTVDFNAASGPTADARVRQALSAAIDRNALVDAVYQGKGSVATSPFPGNSPWASPDTTSQAFDLDSANKLLADYGATAANPLKIELLISKSPAQKQVADIIVADWAAIGVTVTLRTEDDAVSPIVDGTYQAALWGYDVPTDADEFYPWFHTDPSPGQFTYDLTRLHDPNVDRGFDHGRQTDAIADRKKSYADVEQGLTGLVPAIWFAYMPVALVTSPRVVGFDTATTGGVKRGGTPWATAIGFK